MNISASLANQGDARRRLLLVSGGLGLLALAGCATNPDGYQASAVERRLTGRVFEGEWRSGFLYQLTFNGVGKSMTAKVKVVDSDAAGTVYNMSARTVVDGDSVKLEFYNLDRIDHLTYNALSDTLAGHTIFRGQQQNRLMAKGK